MSTTVYIGMDVHSTNYTLSSYIFEEDRHFATVKLSPETDSVLNYVKRIRKEYGDDTDVITGYEAGCLGYTLYKDLKKNDVECIIVAPTSLPKQKAGEIKTDKRDARKIAQCLATGNYKAVYIPDDHDDEIKQYIRMRDDHKLAIKKVKQQILSFCLRNGYKYTQGKNKFTKKHLKWLRDLDMPQLLKIILEEYLISYDYYSLRIEQMDKRIEEFAKEERYKQNCEKLCCLSGMSTHKALCHIVETSDFSRFRKADAYSAYIGTVPGEDSSSDKVKRLGLTKTGNNHLRTLDIEAAHAIGRTAKKKSKALIQRQALCSPEVINYCDRANERMRKMYIDISLRKNKQIAACAVARELSCFIWGLMTDHIS